MAPLEQHSPSSPRPPQLTSLHICQLPYCPYHRVASIRQPRGNSRCQSELRHNHSPLIPIPSTLTCLPYIHPPIIQGSLYSIHPPKPRPPSSTSPVNFCIHYLFQQSFVIHPLHITKPSQNLLLPTFTRNFLLSHTLPNSVTNWHSFLSESATTTVSSANSN